MILWTVFGYLLGSIPFGLVIARALGLGDLRRIGSGNIGATNVLRTGHKGAALATLILDSGKGAIAVLLARWLGGEDAALVAGHVGVEVTTAADLDELRANQEKRADLGRNAREFASQFSWEATGEEWEELLKSL